MDIVELNQEQIRNALYLALSTVIADAIHLRNTTGGAFASEEDIAFAKLVLKGLLS